MNNAKSFKGLAATKTKHLGNKANSDQTAAAKAGERVANIPKVREGN